MANRSDRVLVTGGRGFTGAHLVPLLRATGAQVVSLVDKGPATDNEEGADLRDSGAVHEAVQRIRPTLVVHLAAISSVDHGSSSEIYAVNTLGTHHLLEALVQLQERPRQVILASSANVYGEVPSGAPIDEETPCAPRSHYGASKLAMEAVACVYRETLPIMIARPFNYTGPGQDTRFLVAKIAAHFSLGKAKIELGNLDVSRDFLDVREVARTYMKLLKVESSVGVLPRVNICANRCISLSEILEMLKEITGLDPRIEVNPAFVRQNEIKRLEGNNRRLIELIGEPEVADFRTTLADMVTYYRMHPPRL